MQTVPLKGIQCKQGPSWVASRSSSMLMSISMHCVLSYTESITHCDGTLSPLLTWPLGRFSFIKLWGLVNISYTDLLVFVALSLIHI